MIVGIAALVRSVRHPEAQSRGRAIGAVALNLGILGIAAISIPSLLRAKLSALESATIGDLRTMISAQAAYSQHNDGLYEPRLECLAAPATCLPGYPENGRPFLEPSRLVCFTRDGREPAVTADGRCDLTTCQELQ